MLACLIRKKLDARSLIEHELLNKPSFPSFWQVKCSYHSQSDFAVAATPPERFHFYDLKLWGTSLIWGNQLFSCGKKFPDWGVLVTCRPTVIHLCLVTRIGLALFSFLAWMKLSQSSSKMTKPHVCSRLGAVTWTSFGVWLNPRRLRRKHVVTLQFLPPDYCRWSSSTLHLVSDITGEPRVLLAAVRVCCLCA